MRKSLLFLLIFVFSLSVFAVNENINEFNKVSKNYQCKVFLKYTYSDIYYNVPLVGESTGDPFVLATVLVNCEQQEDIYVIVHVYKNGRHYGSGNVKIPAGCLSSEETKIYVQDEIGGGKAILKIG